MLSDKKYGLSVNIMATRVMPSLLPQTVNPSLNLEQFTILLEVSSNGDPTAPQPARQIRHTHRKRQCGVSRDIGSLYVRVVQQMCNRARAGSIHIHAMFYECGIL